VTYRPDLASEIIANAVDCADATEWFGTLEYSDFTGKLAVSKLHLGREYQDGRCLSAYCGYHPTKPQVEVYMTDEQVARYPKLFCSKCRAGVLAEQEAAR